MWSNYKQGCNFPNIKIKSTQQILVQYWGDFRPEFNWMNDKIQDLPPSYPWKGLRPLRVEDVDLWEVLVETNDRVGVYGAWRPHDELYIITNNGIITHEFYGINANIDTEKYLIANNIKYKKTNKVYYQNKPVETKIFT